MEKIKKIFKKFKKNDKFFSYAQSGEDLIVYRAFIILGISNPSYIDIGAHHPTNLSNTFFFYRKGSTGVCIEPNSDLCKYIKKERPNDICLDVGISDNEAKKAPYYVMTAQTMNTFLKEDTNKTICAYNVYGEQKIEKIQDVDLVPINIIFEKYFQDYGDFVSIDTEGMDEKIVRGINLYKYRPKIFCIETLEQIKDNCFEKNESIIKYMLDNNYFIYADTYINTIFIDKNIWPLSYHK